MGTLLRWGASVTHQGVARNINHRSRRGCHRWLHDLAHAGEGLLSHAGRTGRHRVSPGQCLLWCFLLGGFRSRHELHSCSRLSTLAWQQGAMQGVIAHRRSVCGGFVIGRDDHQPLGLHSHVCGLEGAELASVRLIWRPSEPMQPGVWPCGIIRTPCVCGGHVGAGVRARSGRAACGRTITPGY